MFGLIAEAPRLQLSSVEYRERVHVTLFEHMNSWYCRSLRNCASSSPLLRRYVPTKENNLILSMLGFNRNLYKSCLIYKTIVETVTFLCVSTAVSSQFKANMRLMLDLRAPLRVRSKAIVYSCISGRSTAGRNKVVSGIDSNKARPSFECGWSLRVHIPVYICFVWMYNSVCLKTLLKLNTLSSKIAKSLHVFICGQVTRTVIYRFPGRNLCHRNKVSHTYATQPLVLLFCFHVSIFFF